MLSAIKFWRVNMDPIPQTQAIEIGLECLGALIECEHCSSSYSYESVHSAILTYGAIFVTSNQYGYFGITCPNCLKTIIKRYEIGWINLIYQYYLYKIPLYISPCPELMYFSSTKSSYDIYDSLDRFRIFSWDGDSIEAWEEFKIEHPDFFNSDCLYSYDNKNPIMGYKFCINWYKKDEFERLVEIENEDCMRIIPRYHYRDSSLEAVDEFCWSNYLVVHREENKMARADRSLMQLKSELKYEGRPETESAEYESLSKYISFGQQHLEKVKAYVKSKGDIPHQFLKLLTSDIHDVRLTKFVLNYSDLSKITPSHVLDSQTEDDYAIISILYREKHPFRGKGTPGNITSAQPNPETERKIHLYLEHSNNALNSQRSKALNDFLYDNYNNFISEYLLISRLPNFSYAEVWEIKCNYLKKLNEALAKGAEEDARFAFTRFKNRGCKITYDKKTTIHGKGGFLYLWYLIRNKGKYVDYNDLYSLKPRNIEKGWGERNSVGSNKIEKFDDDKGESIITNKVSSWLHSLKSTPETRKLIKTKLKELRIAQSEEEDPSIWQQLEASIILCRNHLAENFTKNGKIRQEKDQYSKMSGTIGRAIQRELDELKEDNPTAHEHLRESIKRWDGNIAYLPKSDVKWIT
jgi:hypothetical protein